MHVIQAPVSFFDTNPMGRIINRFSSDLYTIDDSLPFILNIFLAQLFGILGTIVVICYGLPWFTLLLLPLGVVYYKIQVNIKKSLYNESGKLYSIENTCLISLPSKECHLISLLIVGDKCIPNFLNCNVISWRVFIICQLWVITSLYWCIKSKKKCYYRKYNSLKKKGSWFKQSDTCTCTGIYPSHNLRVEGLTLIRYLI